MPLRVEDLLQDLALLVLCESGIIRLLHVLELAVGQVGAPVPLDETRGRADLNVRAADLPRLAEALQALDGADVTAEEAVVLEHAEERLQMITYSTIFASRTLSSLVDDVVVLQEEQRLADAVDIVVETPELLEQQLAALRDRARAQRRGSSAHIL